MPLVLLLSAPSHLSSSPLTALFCSRIRLRHESDGSSGTILEEVFEEVKEFALDIPAIFFPSCFPVITFSEDNGCMRSSECSCLTNTKTASDVKEFISDLAAISGSFPSLGKSISSLDVESSIVSRLGTFKR